MPWGYNLRSEGSLFLSKILAIKVFGVWNEIYKVCLKVPPYPLPQAEGVQVGQGLT